MAFVENPAHKTTTRVPSQNPALSAIILPTIRNSLRLTRSVDTESSLHRNKSIFLDWTKEPAVRR